MYLVGVGCLNCDECEIAIWDEVGKELLSMKSGTNEDSIKRTIDVICDFAGDNPVFVGLVKTDNVDVLLRWRRLLDCAQIKHVIVSLRYTPNYLKRAGNLAQESCRDLLIKIDKFKTFSTMSSSS
ncbi:MAG: hypothetical protein K0U21_06240 [Proteobacteria bacterium]|nr:hypothetical protein [Pseudomonadota bacterium]